MFELIAYNILGLCVDCVQTIPMGQNLFALEYFANFVAVEHKQQVRMAHQTANFGDFAVLLLQRDHHLVEVLDAVLAYEKETDFLLLLYA